MPPSLTTSHARGIAFNDEDTKVAENLDGLSKTNIQDCNTALDTRIDYLEGTDADPLTALVLDQSVAGVSGYMSDGNVFITLSAGDLYGNCMNTLAFTLSIPTGDAANQGQLGTLVCLVNGAVFGDSFDLGAAFNAAEQQGTQSYPPQNSPLNTITVTSVEKFATTPVFQIWKGRINVAGINAITPLSHGENSIALRHAVGATNSDSAATIIFYDSVATRPTVGAAPNVAEDTYSSLKQISGVYKYSTGDTFLIGTTLVGAFDNTYVLRPLNFDSSPIAITDFDIAWNSADVTGPSTPPAISDAFVYVPASAVAIDIASVLTENGRIGAFGEDPFGAGATVQSISANRMINTYGNVSTDLIEEFRDENRRIPYYITQAQSWTGIRTFNAVQTYPGDVIGEWDTTEDLVNNDGALQFNDGLIYPDVDFSTGYLPSVPAQPDYSALAGNQFYVRAMYDTDPHTNGMIELEGWVLATFDTTGSPTAKVEIKLPSQTGWLDLGTAFNVATFTGIDGDGCRTSAAGARFEWSSAAFSTASAGNMYIIRITLLNTSVPILTALREIGW